MTPQRVCQARARAAEEDLAEEDKARAWKHSTASPRIFANGARQAWSHIPHSATLTVRPFARDPILGARSWGLRLRI